MAFRIPRALLIAGLAVVLAAAAGGVWLKLGRKPAQARPVAGAGEPHATYVVSRVELADLVSVDGNLVAVQARDLNFSGGGTVAEIPVVEGERVAKGALIARLEDSAARYNLAVVEQSLEEQRLAGAARKIALLELEREVKKAALRDTRIEAPFAGIVSSIDVDPGQTVAASTKVGRVIDRSAFTAAVEVDELDAPRIKPGQEVRFHFEALPELNVRGTVDSVPVEGRVTSDGVAVVDATLRIDRPPAQILPGYSFTAEIVVSPKRELLVVDKKGLIERNGRFIALKVVGPGQPPARQSVEGRDLGDGRYEITSGLSEGDRVLAPPSTTNGTAANAPANPLGLFGIPGGPAGPPGGQLRSGSRPGASR
jgi:multidrug efflux pump subunit AcrA (membrane-fusion protein)